MRRLPETPGVRERLLRGYLFSWHSLNEAIRQTYGRTPSELRNSRRNRQKQGNFEGDNDYVQLKLYHCLPYD